MSVCYTAKTREISHNNPTIMDTKLDQHRKICGQTGERIAKDYLCKKNYNILAANFHSRYGEIDILATRDGVMHVCEVKTRITLTFGTPEEAVNAKKLQKIKKTIQCYQQEHGYAPWQLDVIAIHLAPDFRLKKLTHYKNILG